MPIKKLTQRGEIATILTLISVGLMLLGVVAGKTAVDRTTNNQSKASFIENPDVTEPPLQRPEGSTCFNRNDQSSQGTCETNCIGGTEITGADALLICDSPLICCKKAPTPTTPVLTSIPPTITDSPGTVTNTPAPDERTCPWYPKGMCLPGNQYIKCSQFKPEYTEPNTTLSCGNSGLFCCVLKENSQSPTPSSTSASSCTSCEGGKCIYHPELDERSGRKEPGTAQCTDTGCVSDTQCTADARAGKCAGNGEVCGSDSGATCCDEGNTLRCNSQNKCEPIPVPTIQCPDIASESEAKDKCGTRGYEAVPFSGGYIAGQNAKIINGALIPNCWRCNTKEYCDFGSDDCEIAGKPTPFLNPTKTPNPGGFHLGANIYTKNVDKGVEFQFTIKYYLENCDGDIALDQNGNTIQSKMPANGLGEFVVGPDKTNPPVVGNGQSMDITYTGRYLSYHCVKGKEPSNMNDSVTCKLRVSDNGYAAITGTGCTWENMGDFTPKVRPTVAPGTGSGSDTSSGSATCFPYTCPKSNNKFSVKNGQLYNSANCADGTQVNSYQNVCDGSNAASFCAFVGGRCESDKNRCNKSGDSGNFYSNWGPTNYQATSPLCSTGGCCEPNDGPRGGFYPDPQTPINQQPTGANQTTVGSDNTCYFDYPQNISANTPFSVTAKYVRKNLGATNVHLNFINAGSGSDPSPNKEGAFSKKRILNNNDNTWEESNWTFKNNRLPQGNYRLKLTHDAGKDDGKTECSFTPQITVQSAAATVPSSGGDCTYSFNPSQPESEKDFTVTVNLKSGSSIKPADIVNPYLLKTIGSLSQLIPTNDTKQPWTFKFQPDGNGKMKLNFGWNCAGQNCNNKCGETSINIPSPTPKPGGEPGCPSLGLLLSDECSTCLNNNQLNKEPEQLKPASCSIGQKVALWCTKSVENKLVCNTKANNCNTSGKTCSSTDKAILVGLSLSTQSYINQEYQAVIDATKAGLNALKVSLYVLSASRAPGLQHTFCDPAKNTSPGGCTFGAPPQVGT